MKLIYGLLSGLLLLAGTASSEPLPQRKLIFSVSSEASMDMKLQTVIVEAYRELGYTVILEPMPSARSLLLSNRGDIDGELARTVVVERDYPSLVRVGTLLKLIDLAAFTIDPKFDYRGTVSLKDYVVGVVNGSRLSHYISSYSEQVEVGTEEQLFHMLLKGRLDVVLMNQVIGERFVDKLGVKGQVLVHGRVGRAHVYHYLNDKHQDLIPQVEKAIEKQLKLTQSD